MLLLLAVFPQAVWVIIVISSLTVASLFLGTSIVDFLNSSVVTTIESTTVSLQVVQIVSDLVVAFSVVIHVVHSQEVYFPTVIVCNINQIKKSLFSSLRKSAALADVETGEIEDLLYQQERRIHVQKQWVFNSVRNQC